MSTPNPLMPQGSIPQPGSKGKSNVRLVVFFVVAVHAVFIVGLLVQGCKPEPKPQPVVEPVKAPTPPPTTDALPPLGNDQPAVSTGAPSPTAAAPVAATPRMDVAPTGVPAPVAPTTTTTPDAAAGATHEYVITKGDSFSSIAKKLHVSLKAIQAANPGVDSSKLKIGQKIQVPEGSTAAAAPAPASTGATGAVADSGDAYTVKTGDTLSSIARKHATTVQAIRTANSLKTDRIKVGDKLKVPSARAAAAAPAEPVPTTAAPASAPVLPSGPGSRPPTP